MKLKPFPRINSSTISLTTIFSTTQVPSASHQTTIDLCIIMSMNRHYNIFPHKITWHLTIRFTLTWMLQSIHSAFHYCGFHETPFSYHLIYFRIWKSIKFYFRKTQLIHIPYTQLNLKLAFHLELHFSVCLDFASDSISTTFPFNPAFLPFDHRFTGWSIHHNPVAAFYSC